MKFMKKEYLQRKTREQGQVSWVLGLFLILFLAILLCMQLQVALYRESAMYMEDALALSNGTEPENDLWTGGNTELHNLQCHVRSGRNLAERSGWNGIYMEWKCRKCSCTEWSDD